MRLNLFGKFNCIFLFEEITLKFVEYFSSEKNLPAKIFPGKIFARKKFSREKVCGKIVPDKKFLPEKSFLGKIFPEKIFPGENFSRQKVLRENFCREKFLLGKICFFGGAWTKCWDPSDLAPLSPQCCCFFLQGCRPKNGLYKGNIRQEHI